MIALITIYNKTGKGLILRNNFIQQLMEYDLKEFFMEYFDDLEQLEYQIKQVLAGFKNKGYSNIIEAEKEFVYHIRFIS